MKRYWVSMLVLLYIVTVAVTVSAAVVLTSTPTSLGFGNVLQGQTKVLTYSLKNVTTGKIPVSVSASAPFTVSPATAGLEPGQTITVSVSVPNTATAGTFSGTARAVVKVGGIIVADSRVSVSATVVGLPDFQISVVDNGSSVVGTNRTIGLHLICKSVGLDRLL